MGFTNPLVPRKVAVDNDSNDNDVAAGGQAIFDFVAPNGFMWFLIGLELLAPAVGTTGSHRFDVTTRIVGGPGGEFVTYTRGQSAFDTALEYRFSHWFSANNVQLPSTEIAQLQAVRGIVGDPNRSIRITYNNDTDAAQAAGNVTVNLVLEQLRIEPT